MGKYILFVISCLCIMLNSLCGQVRYYDYSALTMHGDYTTTATCHMDSIDDNGDTLRFLIIKVYSSVDTMLIPASLRVSEASDSLYTFMVDYNRREMIKNDTFIHRFIGLAKGESLTYIIPIKKYLQQNTGYCIEFPYFRIWSDDESYPFEAASQSYLISFSSSTDLDYKVIYYNALASSFLFFHRLESRTSRY